MSKREACSRPHTLDEEPVYLPAGKEEWGELADQLLSLAWKFAERRDPGSRADHEERQRIFRELWGALPEEQRQRWVAGGGGVTLEMEQAWVAAWDEKVRQWNEQAAVQE